MPHRRYLFAFLLLLLPPAARAENFRALSPSGQPVQIVAYGDRNVFVAEVHVRAADGWPEIQSRRYFRTEKELDQFLRLTYPKRQLMPLAAEENAPELEGTGAALWAVKNQWSWEWEKKYADWIRANVTADFFVRHGIATDCADVAYALRWIFSRAHYLPATSRLSTGEWISQNTMRAEWSRLRSGEVWHEDRRFLAALNYLLDHTYTHSLLRDAYPFAIQPGALIEGAFNLMIFDKSGHTQPFVRVLREGEIGIPIETLESTSPRQVRMLTASGYWNGSQYKKEGGGMLRFRWPVAGGRGLVAPNKMPYYSEEQYDPAFVKEGEPFFLTVFHRILPNVELDKLAFDMLGSIKNTLIARQEIVRQGHEFCSKNDCAPGTVGWEDWGTPSRDGRLLSQLSNLSSLRNVLPDEPRAKLEEEIAKPFLAEGSWTFSLNQITWAMGRPGLFSHDPRLSPTERWGLTPEAQVLFFERTFRSVWSARDEFLTKTSNCPASRCTPRSAEWKKNSTALFERQIWQALSTKKSYCSSMSYPEACEASRNLFASRRVDFLGNSISVEELAKRLPHINLDPRHSAEVRRRGLGIFKFVPIGGITNLRTNARFAQFEHDTGGIGIIDLQNGGASITAPAGQWLEVDLKLNQAWYLNQNVVGFRDLLNPSRGGEITLAFTPYRISVISDRFAVALDNENWSLLDISGESIRQIASDRAAQLMVWHPAVFTQKHLDGSFGLLSFGTGTPEFTRLDLPNGIEGNSLNTKTGIFFVNQGKLALIHFGKREIIHYPYPADAIFGQPDGERLIAWTGHSTFDMKFAADGTLESAQALPKGNTINDFTFAYKEGDETTSLILERGKLTAERAFSGETYVSDVSGDYAIAVRTNGSVVRRRGQPQPLRPEAKQVSFVSNDPAEHGLVEFCELEEDYSNWGEACRVEDLSRPELFSLATGFSWNWNGRIAGLASGFARYVGANWFLITRQPD